MSAVVRCPDDAIGYIGISSGSTTVQYLHRHQISIEGHSGRSDTVMSVLSDGSGYVGAMSRDRVIIGAFIVINEVITGYKKRAG